MLSAFYSSAARIRELRDHQEPFGLLLERFAEYLQPYFPQVGERICAQFRSRWEFKVVGGLPGQ